jgi:hypothetical protein
MQYHAVSNTMIDLGTCVGRRQAFGLMSSKCSAADAECLKQIRESKSYKSVAAQWEEFCPRYLGLSRSHSDKIIQQLDEFGAAYFELSQIVRIPEKAYRAISGAISDHSIEYKGETIPISQENGAQIAEVVALLREGSEQLSRQLVRMVAGESATVVMPTEQRRKLRAVRKRLDACFTQLEAIGGSMLLPADRAELVALIAYGLERLNQFQRAA